MSKKKLFDDDSDEDINIKTENEYAKKYDTWREKEEIHKLEQKYGSNILNSDGAGSTDSEDESDEPLEVTEEMEAQFLKTLALLKTKDPRIYDPNFKCFEQEEKQPEKETKSKTLTFDDSDDDDDDQDGEIFKIEKKAEIDDFDVAAEKKDSSAKNRKNKKEGKIKEYLTGQAEHIDDAVEKDLAPLKALWSDPKLNEGEAFLRDYILNKRYLEEGEATDEKVRDDDELEADEKTVEEQTQFERAYNFRFEEPDEEYLKRFPRTMNYIRPKDDRRSRKRAEVRARKEEEKKRKMEEIARLKALKLKEIQDKMARLKEVTGNAELAFKEEDIEGEFDPEEHDRRMRALFDEHFYGEEDQTKPTFPDLDEELEIENWDNYEVENQELDLNQNDDEPHCEDDDFNMDADFDPKQSKKDLLAEIQKTLGKKRRNRKRQSKLAQILAAEKPKFLPLAADRTYAEHMEEYYKLDCEDIVGGMPTRFKYREVLPNDFGLTVEEILLADDKELTQWVPLKKVVKHRPVAAEKSELASYRQRAADERLKRKLLPSLFRDLPEDPELVVPVQETKKKKKKNKHKKADAANDTEEAECENNSKDNVNSNSGENTENENMEVTKSKKNKKSKRKHKSEGQDPGDVPTNNQINGKDEDENATNNGIEERNSTDNKKSKHKNRSEDQISSDIPIDNEINESHEESNKDKAKKSKRKRKLQHEEVGDVTNEHLTNENSIQESHTKSKATKLKKTSNNEGNFNISDNNIVSEENTIVEPVKLKETKNKNKMKNTAATTLPNESLINGQENVQDIAISELNSTNNTSKHKQKFKNKQKQAGKNSNKPAGIKDKKINKLKKKKNKLKLKNQLKSKQNANSSNDNPLGKLSDERLKAYGLNPKKYRGFLKYKKF